MKTKFTWLLAFLAFFICADAGAQAYEQDCINAIPVCAPFYTQVNSYVGTGNYPTELDGTNEGCLLSGEKNDVWYVINVSSPGILAFTITPNNPNDDYDFGLWDITNVGCQAIFNYTTNTPNPYPPVVSNYYGASPSTLGLTGLSATTPPYTNCNYTSPYSPAINVVAGQTFVLNVSNFSSTQSGYSLDFTPSTASIYDTIKPKLTSVSTHCQFSNNILTLKTSEPVKCSSLTSTGSEFTITSASGGVSYPVTSATGLNCGLGPNSATNSITVQCASILPPGTYWFHVNNGTDNNTLLDNCQNPMLPDSVSFTLFPADPPKMISVDTPACIKARIHFDRTFNCATLSADGSNFVITGPENVVVKSANTIACDQSLASIIDVYFTKSIETPGIYTISVKPGSNNTSLADTCQMPITNTVSFVVSDAGSVYASATPGVLCYPGYTQISATASVGGPSSPVSCGVNGSACGTTSTDNAVGSTTTAAGTTLNSPFFGSNANGRTQMLFTAKELLNGGLVNGTITKLGFNVTSKASTAAYTLTVKMGSTTDTAINSFYSSLPVVYTTKAFSTTTGQNSLTLDNPYDWDGTSNLVVEVCFTGAGTGDDAVLTTPAIKTGRVMHNHLNTAIDGCALPSATTTSSDSRPNVVFTQCSRPDGPLSFAWQPGIFTLDSVATTTQAYAPFTRDFVIRIMDNQFCYRRAPAHVTVSVRHPLLYSSDTAICIGLSAYLHAGGGDHYEWYPATNLSCTTCPDPIATPPADITYSVVIYDILACSDTLSEKIVVNPLPIIKATDDTTIVYGSALQLYVTAPGGHYYRWDPATYLNVPTISNPVAKPVENTNYVVTVIDTNQCESRDTVVVGVQVDVPVFVPSGFTPNGDGKNDVFKVANLTFQRIDEFKVFSRCGNIVFQKDNFPPNQQTYGWDGKYNGKALQPDVYVFVVDVLCDNGTILTSKGNVTLLR